MAGINIGPLVAIGAMFFTIAVTFYIILKKKNKWQRTASAGEHCLYSEERSERADYI